MTLSYQLLRTVSWDNLLLLCLCIADMVSTLFWVHNHVATEANPIMNFWLQRGTAAFCIAKLMTVIPFILFTAVLRDRRPRLIKYAVRGTTALYVAAYALGVCGQFVTL